MEQLLVENLKEKWGPVLNCEGMEPIQDNYRQNVTAILLENQEKALKEEANVSLVPTGGEFTNTQGAFNAIAGFDPVLISLVRRSMPNLIAYDVCGVQPMSGPTGLIFAMKSKFTNKAGGEALFDEAPTGFSRSTDGDGSTTGVGFPTFGGTGDPLGVRIGTGAAGSTFGIGGDPNDPERTLSMLSSGGASTSTFETTTFNEMAFVIDRTSVVAKTRALKAEYTSELAQDLKAVHGLDAEVELANILSAEILAEINREVIRNIYRNAKLGCQQPDLRFKGGPADLAGLSGGGGDAGNANQAANVSAASGNSRLGGIYDVVNDSDGRWSAEKFRGLMFQIERESNVIAKETRRGKGNFIITTSDVASALAMSGFLNLTPTPDVNLTVDDTGNTFAGTLNGKIKVYVDPYSVSGADYICVGYRGSSPYDAGMFYCPYVPLQMVRSVSENTFQPKIGFKTRYGMVNNPFVSGNGVGSDANKSDPSSDAAIRSNQYYRIFRVIGLHGGASI